MIKPVGKKTLKRSGIIGIVSLFLSTAYFPIAQAHQEKPDLIITYVGIVPYGGSDCATATIKNIGDAETLGRIYVKYRCIRMFLQIGNRIGMDWTSSIVPPGGTITLFMIYEYQLPKFGIFEFNCTVNPDGTMNESNYGNNALSQVYFAFFGQWFQIG